mmetsp:Transcript_20105/g.50999  ORF Transcript_20105/g.50999 Transcript_20105/m.50999 type:complete len:211 (-) Transcript_20105:522-1154(-)
MAPRDTNTRTSSAWSMSSHARTSRSKAAPRGRPCSERTASGARSGSSASVRSSKMRWDCSSRCSASRSVRQHSAPHEARQKASCASSMCFSAAVQRGMTPAPSPRCSAASSALNSGSKAGAVRAASLGLRHSSLAKNRPSVWPCRRSSPSTHCSLASSRATSGASRSIGYGSSGMGHMVTRKFSEKTARRSISSSASSPSFASSSACEVR